MNSSRAAALVPPAPSASAAASTRVGATLIRFSESIVDHEMGLANARAAARGFYDELLESEARIAELEDELQACRRRTTELEAAVVRNDVRAERAERRVAELERSP